MKNSREAVEKIFYKMLKSGVIYYTRFKKMVAPI